MLTILTTRPRASSACADLTKLATCIIVSATVLCISDGLALEGYDVDPQTGLRMERYRAPVPADIPGGITLDTAAAVREYHDGHMIFIDVYPPTGMGPDPLDGHWVISEIRQSIPSAIWLPEVGRGSLQPDAETYFQRNLARITDNTLDRAITFFCTADCWQSWNAARRAIDWGYTAVHWYPLGSDGWLETGNSLEPAQPVNFLDDSTPSTSPFPDTATVYLVDQHNTETAIATVVFSSHDSELAAAVVDMNGDTLEDQFLSMRPFRCLTQSDEWFCHLPYPYELEHTVTDADLTDLEYQLLFIWKSPTAFGIDAWNGVYYKLTLHDDQTMTGELLQGDLNVIAHPPEPGSRPIDLSEFTVQEAQRRRFPTLVIRP